MAAAPARRATAAGSFRVPSLVLTSAFLAQQVFLLTVSVWPRPTAAQFADSPDSARQSGLHAAEATASHTRQLSSPAPAHHPPELPQAAARTGRAAQTDRPPFQTELWSKPISFVQAWFLRPAFFTVALLPDLTQTLLWKFGPRGPHVPDITLVDISSPLGQVIGRIPSPFALRGRPPQPIPGDYILPQQVPLPVEENEPQPPRIVPHIIGPRPAGSGRAAESRIEGNTVTVRATQTFDVPGLGTVRILESPRRTNGTRDPYFLDGTTYNASAGDPRAPLRTGDTYFRFVSATPLRVEIGRVRPRRQFSPTGVFDWETGAQVR